MKTRARKVKNKASAFPGLIWQFKSVASEIERIALQLDIEQREALACELLRWATLFQLKKKSNGFFDATGLDPVLAEMAGGWNPEKRLNWAGIYSRWAQQLIATIQNLRRPQFNRVEISARSVMLTEVKISEFQEN